MPSKRGEDGISLCYSLNKNAGLYEIYSSEPGGPPKVISVWNRVVRLRYSRVGLFVLPDSGHPTIGWIDTHNNRLAKVVDFSKQAPADDNSWLWSRIQRGVRFLPVLRRFPSPRERVGVSLRGAVPDLSAHREGRAEAPSWRSSGESPDGGSC